MHILILGRVLQRAKNASNIPPDYGPIIERLSKTLAVCHKSEHIQEVYLTSEELDAIQEWL